MNYQKEEIDVKLQAAGFAPVYEERESPKGAINMIIKGLKPKEYAVIRKIFKEYF